MQKLYLEKVKAGDVGPRPSERRRLVEEQQGPGLPMYGGGGRSGSGGLEGHGGNTFGTHNGGGYDIPPARGQYGGRGGQGPGRAGGYDYGSGGGRGGYQEARDGLPGGQYGCVSSKHCRKVGPSSSSTWNSGREAPFCPTRGRGRQLRALKGRREERAGLGQADGVNSFEDVLVLEKLLKAGHLLVFA